MKVLEIDLRDNERIILKTRQHWILLLWPTWKFLLLAGLGIWPAAYFNAFSGNTLVFLGYLIWVLLWFNVWFRDFLEWFLNVYVLTNYRILNISHETIFRRQTTEASLSRVQDVTHKTLGMISMMFKFGDVIIQTAGHKTLIHFHMVPKPNEIHRQISKLVSSHAEHPVSHQPRFMKQG